jgi:cytidine deaminase
LGGALSLNPFQADADVRERVSAISRACGDAVRTSLRAALAAGRHDLAGNMGGVVAGSAAAAIARQNGISADELMLLALEVAQDFAHPPISGFHVGAVGCEAGTGNLVFGGNLEFPGAGIANTVHGEGFVFCRAFSRGTSIDTLALGEAHPCAHCRQFLSEFATSRDLVLIDPLGHRLTLAQLYPWPFDPGYLGETGIVPGEEHDRTFNLPRRGTAADPGREALEAAGRRSHVPYGKSPAAVQLRLRDGATVTGATIESVAFNPAMTPMQTALIDLHAHGYSFEDIVDAAVATVPGAPIDYVSAARELLSAVAPHVSLAVIQGREPNADDTAPLLSDRWSGFEVTLASAEPMFAVLPVGALEDHGLHLPMTTDTILAKAVALRIAGQIDGWLLPAIGYGETWTSVSWDGTLSISPETLRAIIVDIGRGLLRTGNISLVIVNGHFGNRSPIELAARDLKAMKLPVLYLDYPGLEAIAAEVCESKPAAPGFYHADEVETSMMLAVAPESVSMPAATANYPQFPPTWGHEALRLRDFAGMSVFGDPRPATSVKGRKIIAHIVEESVRLIKGWAP